MAHFYAIWGANIFETFCDTFILPKTTKILEQFPESGAIPQDRVLKSIGYRFLVYKDYLLFYQYSKQENTAYVSAIFNGKRDYMRVLKKFL